MKVVIMLTNEIFLIFFQNFLFFYIFIIPKIFRFNTIRLSIFDTAGINIIFFSNICLICSFFNFNYKYLFFSILIFSLIFIVINRNEIRNNLNFPLIIFCILTIILSINIAYELTFDWDTKTFWYLKVVNFFHNKPIEHLSSLPVPDWPHLGPFIWSFFWKFPFEYNEYFGRLFFNFFYLISIFSICETFSKKKLFNTILSVLIVLITYNYNFFSGEQDVFIFSVLIILTKISLFLFSRNIRSYEKFVLVFITILCFNILFWIKIEGIIFSLIVLIGYFFFKILNKRQNYLIFFGFAICLCLKFLLSNYFGLSINSKWFEFNQTMSLDIFSLLLRLKILITYFIFYCLNLPIYSILFILLTFLYLKKIKLNEHDKFLIFILVFNLIFLILAFMLKSDDIEKQIKSSLKMFMYGSSGFYILLIVNLLSKFKIIQK